MTKYKTNTQNYELLMWGRAEWLGKDENEMEQRQEKGNDISWTKLRQEEITQTGKHSQKSA